MELRYPNITGTTEREMLLQIKSYLNQLVPQLEFAMSNVSASTATAITPTTKVVSTAPTNADAQATFNSIKTLIIKSADIVNAYYDEINKRLEGTYVAESSFGTFIEDTTASIVANSKSITQNYTNTQEIISEIKTEVSRIDTTAYIKTGELETLADGTTVYGVEIGQETEQNGEKSLDKCARFTSGKLSFYENDTPIAWISGYKLCITSAEIEYSLTLGNFVIETEKGLTLRWVKKEE